MVYKLINMEKDDFNKHLIIARIICKIKENKKLKKPLNQIKENTKQVSPLYQGDIDKFKMEIETINLLDPGVYKEKIEERF